MLCCTRRRIWTKRYLYIGVPVVIGRNGEEKVVDYNLTQEENAEFIMSANAVRSMNNVHKELGIL